mmetsp:Transcript_35932/g.58094  ORF Transcript_35932/g.58094 Transcript_35932/m.58094 type:complete len:247 (-) Transcript_35932:169-909(-)
MNDLGKFHCDIIFVAAKCCINDDRGADADWGHQHMGQDKTLRSPHVSIHVKQFNVLTGNGREELESAQGIEVIHSARHKLAHVLIDFARLFKHGQVLLVCIFSLGTPSPEPVVDNAHCSNLLHHTIDATTVMAHHTTLALVNNLLADCTACNNFDARVAQAFQEDLAISIHQHHATACLANNLQDCQDWFEVTMMEHRQFQFDIAKVPSTVCQFEPACTTRCVLVRNAQPCIEDSVRHWISLGHLI